MSVKDDLRRLIVNHQRRLQVLKEQQALYGRSTPPEIVIEIEDIEQLLQTLQAQLTDLPHIFISYKRNVEPDETVALQVHQVLSQQYPVFIDQVMPVGTYWAERIETELRQAHFLITFLSAESVQSEMVEAEIAMAYRLAKEQDGYPMILPVRLAYRAPFPYPLSTYLDQINWAFWQNDQDTPRLIAELGQAISGDPLTVDEQAKATLLRVQPPVSLPPPLTAAQPVRLTPPEGTMALDSAFYIERQTDQIALAAIQRQGETITIKGPRQMGKSSLLIRIKATAVSAGKVVAFLDFQLFDKSDFASSDTFLRKFCTWLTYELEVDDQIEQYWKIPLSNNMRCTRYLSHYLLKDLDRPLVLAMDEVDRLFDTDFRSDFFGMLRSWHNSREINSIWNRLDLALVTSTEPYQFIDNLNQSPFNVGEIIELTDFTLQQVTDLNQRHNSPLNSDELVQLMTLLAGHPYLVRRALYLLASKRISVLDLFKYAADDRGPFGDHLRHHLFRLYDRPHMIKTLQQVINTNTCDDERIFFRLQSAGLIRRQGQAVLPRCQLYTSYFRERLSG